MASCPIEADGSVKLSMYILGTVPISFRVATGQVHSTVSVQQLLNSGISVEWLRENGRPVNNYKGHGYTPLSECYEIILPNIRLENFNIFNCPFIVRLGVTRAKQLPDVIGTGFLRFFNMEFNYSRGLCFYQPVPAKQLEVSPGICQQVVEMTLENSARPVHADRTIPPLNAQQISPIAETETTSVFDNNSLDEAQLYLYALLEDATLSVSIKHRLGTQDFIVYQFEPVDPKERWIMVGKLMEFNIIEHPYTNVSPALGDTLDLYLRQNAREIWKAVESEPQLQQRDYYIRNYPGTLSLLSKINTLKMISSHRVNRQFGNTLQLIVPMPTELLLTSLTMQLAFTCEEYSYSTPGAPEIELNWAEPGFDRDILIKSLHRNTGALAESLHLSLTPTTRLGITPRKVTNFKYTKWSPGIIVGHYDLEHPSGERCPVIDILNNLQATVTLPLFIRGLAAQEHGGFLVVEVPLLQGVFSTAAQCPMDPQAARNFTYPLEVLLPYLQPEQIIDYFIRTPYDGLALYISPQTGRRFCYGWPDSSGKYFPSKRVVAEAEFNARQFEMLLDTQLPTA